MDCLILLHAGQGTDGSHGPGAGAAHFLALGGTLCSEVACDEAQESCRPRVGRPPFSFLFILRSSASISSFLHSGGSNATRGKGELERCPKGRNAVIREVENRTEPKESGSDCAVCGTLSTVQHSARGQRSSPETKKKKGKLANCPLAAHVLPRDS